MNAYTRTSIKSCRPRSYGVELAYALFTVCFHKHNQKMTSSTGHIYPIEFYHSSLQNSCVEKFGLSFASSDSSISESEHHSAPRLDITSCTYAELYARISGTPACHMIQGSDADSDGEQDCLDESHDDAGLAIPSHDCETPNILMVKAVLVKALAWYFTHKAITRISPNSTS